MNAPEFVRYHTNQGIYCVLAVRGGRKWYGSSSSTARCAYARCGLPRSQEPDVQMSISI